jgi:hypothetical protein
MLTPSSLGGSDRPRRRHDAQRSFPVLIAVTRAHPSMLSLHLLAGLPYRHLKRAR